MLPVPLRMFHIHPAAALFHRVRWFGLACLVLLAGCTADPAVTAVIEEELAAAFQQVEAAPAAEDAAGSPTEADPEPAAAEASAESGPAAVQVGLTDDGWPFMGLPDALVVVTEYSDFHCPYCGRHANETLPRIRTELIETGLIQYVVKDLPLESIHPQARLAHRAAWCMGLQHVEAFWWMHEALYATQSQHARNGDPVPFFEALAAEYNEQPDMDAAVDSGAFSSCLLDVTNDVDQRIDTAIGNALDLGIQGTPTFTIHLRGDPGQYMVLRGAQPYERFADAVFNAEQYVAEGVGVEPEEADSPDSLPFWLSAQGLTPLLLWGRADTEEAPFGAWHGLTQAGDFFKGSPLAEVVVFEFSDFQCPYCQRHTTTVQEELDAAWIDTGRIMWIYKHFLLDSSQWSGTAAIATICAGVQGRFWDLHHLLFEDPAAWSHRDVDEAMDNFGATLLQAGDSDWHLASLPSEVEAGHALLDDLAVLPLSPPPTFDEAAYRECRATTGLDLINMFMAQVQGVVRGTPTFVIWHRDYGLLAQPVVGALPVEQFQSVFEQIFAQLAALEAAG